MEIIGNEPVVTVLIALLLCLCNAAPRDGELRLVRQNGAEPTSMGNVQIYHNGRWGALCDDGWTINGAHVACRMLGFKRAQGHTKQSYFGKADKDFWLDDVQCYGDEANLLQCSHRNWGKHNCDIREAAGVSCEPKLLEANRPAISTIRLPPSTSTSSRTTTWWNAQSRNTQSSTSRTTRPTPSTTTQQPRRSSSNQQTRRPSTRRPTQQTRRPHTRRPTTQQTRRPTTNRNNNNRRPRPDDGFVNDGGAVQQDRTTTRVRPTKPPRRTTVRASTTKKVPKPKKKPNKKQDPSTNKVYNSNNVPNYDIRVRGGRTNTEGRVEVRIDGKWGTLCSDNWTLREAMVVCKHVGLNYAQAAVGLNYFGGEDMDKVASGIRCEGHEKKLYKCFHEHVHLNNIACPAMNQIAGVICTDFLPDLVPNATLLMQSAYLQDRQMYYLQCAMEEGCAASSAYHIKDTSPNWARQTRRLLRFSSSTWNMGTADFRPFISKHDWEWHSCHMHYHSMEVFAHYDVLDLHGNRVAEGHKASFCLEDVQCFNGRKRKYRCQGYGDQGISVGCADDYLHDIDCQWIDMSDVTPGDYIFRIHINPESKVAELNFDNNAVTCKLAYTNYSAKVSDCVLSTKITKNKIV